MAKIMLVEDDNNLREIYEARLLAEGYEIVSARDGEEALALAVKEKPDLIISDVMMPKISGFDMLDILRSTPETKYTKVIMMTALSQAEDKTRADKLGADRYLVKSQVTLEDVAKVAKEVLSGESAPETPAPEPVAQVAQVPEPSPAPIMQPVAPPTEPPTTVTLPVNTAADAQTSADEAAKVAEQINQFVSAPVDNPPAAVPSPQPVSVPTEPATIEVATAPTDTVEAAADNAEKLAAVVNGVIDQKTAEDSSAAAEVSGKKVISPINDLNVKPDFEKMAAEQEAIDTANEAAAIPPATSVVEPQASDSAPEAPASPEAGTTQSQAPKPGDQIDPNSVSL